MGCVFSEDACDTPPKTITPPKTKQIRRNLLRDFSEVCDTPPKICDSPRIFQINENEFSCITTFLSPLDKSSFKCTCKTARQIYENYYFNCFHVLYPRFNLDKHGAMTIFRGNSNNCRAIKIFGEAPTQELADKGNFDLGIGWGDRMVDDVSYHDIFVGTFERGRFIEGTHYTRKQSSDGNLISRMIRRGVFGGEKLYEGCMKAYYKEDSFDMAKVSIGRFIHDFSITGDVLCTRATLDIGICKVFVKKDGKLLSKVFGRKKRGGYTDIMKYN